MEIDVSARFHLIALAITLLPCLPQNAAADPCQEVVAAMRATMKAPALRQFLTSNHSHEERLMTIIVGDTVYMMMGGSKPISTMSRQEARQSVDQAAIENSVVDCRLVGHEKVAGTPTRLYTYTSDDGAGGSIASKVWIGDDGLLREQSADDGMIRYEYENVIAPAN
jgi:hypothetical protein